MTKDAWPKVIKVSAPWVAVTVAIIVGWPPVEVLMLAFLAFATSIFINVE